MKGKIGRGLHMKQVPLDVPHNRVHDKNEEEWWEDASLMKEGTDVNVSHNRVYYKNEQKWWKGASRWK